MANYAPPGYDWERDPCDYILRDVPASRYDLGPAKRRWIAHLNEELQRMIYDTPQAVQR